MSDAPNQQTPDYDAPPVRELTVEQLIERLRELPPHHYVSPIIDGVLGAGIDVWQMFDPQTKEVIVAFGEPEPQSPVIVAPDWTRVNPSGSSAS